MGWKQNVVIVASGITAGLVIAQFMRDDKTPNGQVQLNASGASQEEKSLRKTELQSQFANLKMENDRLRSELATAAHSGKASASRPLTLTGNEYSRYQQETLEKRAAAISEKNTKLLLAAGYSMDRIEFLSRKSDELDEKRRREETERRKLGLPVDPTKEMTWVHEPYSELRYEIGDAEYEKFLKALDRPSNAEVHEVFKGSIAESVGIKPGDEIIEYNNKRIFNVGELNGLSMKVAESGGTASIKLKRGGQILLLHVPGGNIGIRSSRALSTTPKNLVPINTNSK